MEKKQHAVTCVTKILMFVFSCFLSETEINLTFRLVL